MTSILAITFPIYAAIALGYLVVKKGWFDKSEMRTLGKYVLNIALPALLFSAAVSRDLGELIRPGYLAVYAAGGMACIAVSYVFLSLRGLDPERRALGVMGSSCPNSGFIGYPVMLLLSPELAPVILALNFLTESILLVPVCLMLLEIAATKGSRPAAKQLLEILINVFKMPMILALLAGLAVSFTGINLPAPGEKTITLIAASASAVSLLVIGGSLVDLPFHGNRSLAVQITAQKLLLHPLLVAGTLVLFTGLGLVHLEPDLQRAVILSAAVPMFSIYTLLAQKFGLDGAASLAMLGATTGAFVTLSLLLFWMI